MAALRTYLPVFIFIAFMQLSLAPSVTAQHQPVHANIDMTCFPAPPAPGEPPGIGPLAPCLLPTELPAEFVSPNPSGKAKMMVRSNGTAQFNIDLEGLAPDLVITAWISYYFPGGPAPHPIFDSADPNLPPVAGVSAPLAPTTAGFTEGLGFEPNQFVVKNNGKGKLVVNLDYNPLLPGQGPLRNAMTNTNQALAPAGGEAEQPVCCPNGIPAPSYQAVGSSYLRKFDMDTGFQILDAQGVPELVRSPLPVAFLAIVVHTDKTTHGINPGIPILPIPGLSASTGDHFLLGMFDLRAYHPAESAPAVVHDQEKLEKPYTLSGVYPNPFNPTTTVQLSVAERQHVRVEVFDLLGRSVGLLHNSELDAGMDHIFTFNASHLASGRYLLRVTGQEFATSKNIVLMK